MWLCYLRFEDQRQVVTFHIRCEAQADIDEIVRRSKLHGQTPTARFVEHARFYSSHTIFPRSVPEGQWYDWWEIHNSTKQLVLIDQDTPPEPYRFGGPDIRRPYRFPCASVVCCTNLTLTEVQGQVCECLVRTDTGQPGWVKPEEIGKEIIQVRVLKRMRDQTPESSLSTLLASIV